ncbi:MAG TPA: hypothetical protein VNO81_07945 [Candidatus Nitrosotenuis sp.]|jgi:hypothetical protein|nr:hypothetical protein [Candidatus Nitrosotenuis sp.]
MTATAKMAVTALAGALRSLIGRRARPADPEAGSLPRRLLAQGHQDVVLDRILILLARRPGDREPARLFTRRLSCRQIWFCTQDALRPGDPCQLHILLEPERSVSVPGRVVRLEGQGRLRRGLLEIEPDLPEGCTLLSYLDRYRP